MTAQRFALTAKGRLALALARLDRAWGDVPPPIQARLIAAVGAVADDYQPERHAAACPCDWCWDAADMRDGTHTDMADRRGPAPRGRVPLVGRLAV